MKNDLISIVVPVYNVDKYLEKCLNSILNQTYDNIEIILVDDGSKDDSGKICDIYKEKDNRIKVIHKTNGGLSDARNIGIDNVNGKYITFVDSDDTIEKNYIEYLYNLLKKNNTKLSICNYNVVSNNKVIPYIKKDYEIKLDKVTALGELLRERLFSVSSCAKLYDVELFNDVRFPIGMLCEDNGTTYKLIEKCDYVSYGSKSKYNYYKRDNSIMTSSFNERKFDLIKLVDKMKDDLEPKYPELHDEILRKQISSRFSVLRQIVLSDYNNQKKINAIVEFLKQNKKFILKCSSINIREKIALITLLIDINFFKFSWVIYTKIKY